MKSFIFPNICRNFFVVGYIELENNYALTMIKNDEHVSW